MASTQSIVHSRALEITDQDIARRKAFVGLEPVDIERIVSIKDLVVGKADDLSDVFFTFLRRIEEAAPLFERADLLTEAKRLKREHLIAMVQGKYDKAYVDQRLQLGMLYCKVALDVRVFLGAFHHLMKAVGAAIMHDGRNDPSAAFEKFMSLKKVGFFDIGIIVDVMVAERERIISQQQEAIRELSTPVLQVRDRLQSQSRGYGYYRGCRGRFEGRQPPGANRCGGAVDGSRRDRDGSLSRCGASPRGAWSRPAIDHHRWRFAGRARIGGAASRRQANRVGRRHLSERQHASSHPQTRERVDRLYSGGAD